MPYFKFPQTVYDQPKNLLAVLGSWWADTYAGREEIASLVQGKARIENQSLFNVMELIAAISRFSVPIYHSENWYPLYLLASQRNNAQTSLLRYDAGATFNGSYSYDIPTEKPFHAFPCPATLVSAPLIVNRFTDPTLTQNENLDYVLVDNAIIFRSNPFDDPRVAKRTVYTNGVPTDTEALVWVFQGQFDFDTVYQQFGYAVGLRLKSSAGYRDLLNTVYDAIVGGTTANDIMRGMSAMTGVPLVQEDQETVVDIVADPVNLIIITDLHVYKFGVNAVPTVVVGQKVFRGEALTDALQINELNCGVTPDSLRALAIGQGFLMTCFYSDLVFENREVLLQVITDDPSGYTKLKWDLGGFPLDVEKFFDELHYRGVLESERPIDPCEEGVKTIAYQRNDCNEVDVIQRKGTLAHLLDRRENSVDEPKASNLPDTINPLKFLIENVLRNNAFIVRLKPASAGHNGVGLYNARMLRRLLHPGTALILIVDLTPDADLVTVDRLAEQITTFTGMTPLKDTVTTVVDRRVGIRIITGSCQ